MLRRSLIRSALVSLLVFPFLGVSPTAGQGEDVAGVDPTPSVVTPADHSFTASVTNVYRCGPDNANLCARCSYHDNSGDAPRVGLECQIKRARRLLADPLCAGAARDGRWIDVTWRAVETEPGNGRGWDAYGYLMIFDSNGNLIATRRSPGTVYVLYNQC